MGMFGNIISGSKDTSTDKLRETLINKINTILLIMKNLGYLNNTTIKNVLDATQTNYDEDILNELKIYLDSNNIKELINYVPSNELAYGIIKIEELKSIFNKILEENLEKEAEEAAITDELLFTAKIEISKYETIIRTFNEKIKEILLDDSLNEKKKNSKINDIIHYYKEEKLGYPVNYKEHIDNYVKLLEDLEFGGYGEREISKFRNQCKEEIKRLKTENIPNEIILKRIEKDIFNPLKNRYINILIVLKRRITIIESSKELNELDKEKQIQEFIIDFNEKNGHIIDLGNQLALMKERLMGLKNDSLIINNFTSDALKIITTYRNQNKPDKTILATLRIRYSEYVESNPEPLVEIPLEEKIEEFVIEGEEDIDLEKEISMMVDNLRKSECLEENVNEFNQTSKEISGNIELINSEKLFEIKKVYEEIMTRKNITLNKLIEADAKKLEELGYGASAIMDFISDCHIILKTNTTDEDKKMQINSKMKLLENNFTYNQKLFLLWKENELNKTEGVHTEYENELDKQIKYLLSLSPKALQMYYEEDKQKKQEAREQHNFILAVKHLATKEALKNNDPNLVDKRLATLASGVNPYTDEEITQAKEELELKELLDENNDLTKEEKLISMVEYIDSTLYHQMFRAGSKIHKSNYNENITT